jgi:hypothetical protein
LSQVGGVLRFTTLEAIAPVLRGRGREGYPRLCIRPMAADWCLPQATAGRVLDAAAAAAAERGREEARSSLGFGGATYSARRRCGFSLGLRRFVLGRLLGFAHALGTFRLGTRLLKFFLMEFHSFVLWYKIKHLRNWLVSALGFGLVIYVLEMLWNKNLRVVFVH